MNIVDQIRDIKYKRLKPEENFLIDIMNKVSIEKNDKYPNSEFYYVDDKILFEQDSKYKHFWVNSDKIWLILKLEYGINDQKISKLIQIVVWKYLKRKVDTPVEYSVLNGFLVWKNI